MIAITEALKKRFCKDCNIPINLFKEPFFNERINTFDSLYGTAEKWKRFVNVIQKYNSPQDYFEDYNRVKDAAISVIKESDGYKTFNSEDMSRYSISDQYKKITSNSIYHIGNDGRYFISVDMKKANFTVLNSYDKSIFNADTWEDFLRKFTDNEHIINSKYIRQVIMGNCNPSRHITYMRYITSQQISELETKNPALNVKRIVSLASDEIVYDVTDLSIDGIKTVLESLGKSQQFEYTGFQLKDIVGCAYVKKFVDGNIKIKCAENEFLPMIVRRLSGDNNFHETDLYFPFKGELARFEDVPKPLKEFVQHE